MGRLLDFCRDQRGNTAMIFGLAMVPLLGLGGGVVDFAQRARIHTHLQTMSDTAALAATRIIQNGQLKREADWDALKAKAETAAHNLIVASLQEYTQDQPTVDVDVTKDFVTVAAHYDMKTSFLGVVGMNTLPVSTVAKANVPDPTLVEIAMVLDYSLSMNQNSKYQRMTTAARDFIQKVGDTRGDRTKIGIVPFSEFVYADVADSDVRAPDTSGAYPWSHADDHDGSHTGGGSSWDDGVDGGSVVDSAKCLLNRDYPYAATNETPNGAMASRWNQADPNSSRCRAYRLGNLKARDLTDDFDGLREALANMKPVGWTNISLASEMGWHMLSSNEPFEAARPESDPDVERIMILLTDGMQTVAAMGPTGDVSNADADRTTAELCTNAKANKIHIYTIAYDVDNTAVYDLLSNCASDPGSYFEVHDSSGISAVFDAIFARLQESAWLSQ